MRTRVFVRFADRKRYSTISLMFFLGAFVAQNSACAEESKSTSFEKLAPKIEKLVCEDKFFLTRTKTETSACLSVAKTNRNQCTMLIQPFMPEIVLEQPDSNYVGRFEKLGLLYGMCIRSEILMSDLNALVESESTSEP